jgi:hypothetical protein
MHTQQKCIVHLLLFASIILGIMAAGRLPTAQRWLIQQHEADRSLLKLLDVSNIAEKLYHQEWFLQKKQSNQILFHVLNEATAGPQYTRSFELQEPYSWTVPEPPQFSGTRRLSSTSRGSVPVMDVRYQI